MDSGEQLFPSAPTGNQAVQKNTGRHKFSSFRPIEAAGSERIEVLLSSEEESDAASLADSSTKKRSQVSLLESSLKPEGKRQRKRSEDDGFFFDKKGDQQNLQYQGLYRLHVPSYHRSFTPACPSNNASSFQRAERYFAPGNVLKERSKKMQRMLFPRRIHGQAEQSTDVVELFIPFGGFEDSSVLEKGLLVESVEESVLRKIREFNIQLRNNPYDLALWMQFACYQDEAIALTRRRVRLHLLHPEGESLCHQISSAIIAEKKISILSSALKFHPKSEELVCQLLQLTSVLSSPSECNEKYQAALSRLSHSFPLWKSYWSYTKSTFGEFSCEKMRGAYEGGLRAIRANIQERSSLFVQTDKAEEEMVAVFLLSVQFDLQSGHAEKAIAKMQACLEWIFCSPDNKNSLSEEVLHSFFKQFWESSQIPKLGEQGAKGFAAFVDDQILDSAPMRHKPIRTESTHLNAVERSTEGGGWTGWFEVSAQTEAQPEAAEDDFDEDETSTDEHEDEETEAQLMKEIGMKLEELEDITSVSQDVLNKFLRTENERTNEGCLPLKPDSLDDIDLDKLVLFEELQPLLFDLKRDQTKKKLLLGIFRLLGLDVSDLVCSNDGLFRELQSGIDRFPFQIDSSLQRVFGSIVATNDLSWYQLHHGRREFLLNLLEFFAVDLFQSDIRIRKLWLRLAAGMENCGESGSTIKDVGKKILEKYKDDVNLWAAYASVLFENGYAKESERVWKAVLTSMAQASQTHSLVNPISIIVERLEASEPNLLNLGLLAYVMSKDSSHLEDYLSKASQTKSGLPSRLNPEISNTYKHTLEERVKRSLSRELTWSDYEDIICLVHFEALTQTGATGSIQKTDVYACAARCLSNILCSLPNGIVKQSRQCEALHERYCFWLFKAAVAPSQLKTEILSSLAIFPSSFELLMLLIQVFAGSHMTTTLLNDLKEHVFRSPTTDTLVLLLVLEKLRALQNLNLSSLTEKILKLTNVDCSLSPLVWRLYLRSVSSTGGSDVKRVFLRSVRACPWSKLVWLEGLELSQGSLTGTEIAELLETMKDKGVGLRTDIYEILLETAV